MKGKWWTLIAVMIGMFMLLLDITIGNVACTATTASPPTWRSPWHTVSRGMIGPGLVNRRSGQRRRPRR